MGREQKMAPYPDGDAIGRTTGYFVDLCGNEPSVDVFYMNGGKPGATPYDDIPRENLSDAPSNSSTLAGAFILNNVITYDFRTGHPESYAAISERFGGNVYKQKVPAIRMVGLNSSNNTTEFDKPIHVSAFRTGQGCPGVNLSTFPVMQKMIKHGKSLYMAYAGTRYEQKSMNSCVNDSSGPKISPASDKRVKRSVASPPKAN